MEVPLNLVGLARADVGRSRGMARDVLAVATMVTVFIWSLPIRSPQEAALAIPPWRFMMIPLIGAILSWLTRSRWSTLSSAVFVLYAFAFSFTMLAGFDHMVSYAMACVTLVAIGLVASKYFLIVVAIAYMTIPVIRNVPLMLDFVSLMSLGATLAPIVAATIVSWLSASSIESAFSLASHSVAQAWDRAEEARNRRGELARAMRALEESSYRIQRLNDQLELALKRATEAEALKTRFAASISHELRTPLNLIVGLSRLLFEHPEIYGVTHSQKHLHDLSIIHKNALQLQGMVEDVLDLVQIQSTRMTITLENEDPASIVRETIDSVHSLADEKGLRLSLDVPPHLPRILVDRIRIRQVLINLLNNAIRLTDRGEISVRATLGDGEMVFSVEDTGPGIAESDLPHLFKEFHQLGGSLSRRRGGAGLGLAISKGFVELHGGRIWAESEVGRGSRFSFSIPIDVNSVRVAHLEQAATRSHGPDREKVAILVTQSEKAFRLLSRNLWGCQVLLVKDVTQIAATVRQAKPGWIIVDQAALKPASMENLEFALLAESTEVGDVPILYCRLPQDTQKHLPDVVKGYLLKPVSNEHVLAAMRQVGPSVHTVLVIDDDPDFVHYLARLLAVPPLSYRVIRAYSAAEGLEIASLSKPDLVLLDVALPDASGWDLVPRFAADPILADMPVIMVTGGQLEDGTGEGEARSSLVVSTTCGGLDAGNLLEAVQSLIAVREPGNPSGNGAP